MLTQTDLFDLPVPHNRTETSREAAQEIKTKIGRYQQMVLDHLRMAENGLTRDELALLSGLATATICGRCNELLNLGLIEPRYEGFEKVKRKTRSGKNAEVLFLR
jgi:Fic family protein